MPYVAGAGKGGAAVPTPPRAVEEPCRGEVVHVVAGPVATGTVLAEAGGGTEDDRRVGGTESLVADAQAVGHAGPEALDDDVRIGGKRQEGVAAVVMA